MKTYLACIINKKGNIPPCKTDNGMISGIYLFRFLRTKKRSAKTITGNKPENSKVE
jgi:hypothetical protein